MLRFQIQSENSGLSFKLIAAIQQEPSTVQRSYENLLYHIVLPRVLPQERSADHEQHSLCLLLALNATIKMYSDLVPSATKRLFSSLKRTHMVHTSENISQEINALKPGE